MSITFDAALDVVEQLDLEQQQELVQIVTRRLAERGRQRLIETVQQAEREFANGECRPMTPEEILREALDE